MDSKWFVYIGDHAEGPFTPDQIEVALRGGKLAPGFLAWTRGMQDWQPLELIDELRSRLIDAQEQSKSGPKRVGTLTELMSLPRGNEERSDWIGPAERARALAEAEKVLQRMEAERRTREQREFRTDIWRQVRAVLLALVFAASVAGIFGGTWLFLTRNGVQSPLRTFVVTHQQTYPVLRQWFDPLPALSVWNSADLERFTKTVSEPFGMGAVRIAYVFEGQDQGAPILWVVSNLPLETGLRVRVTAKRGTLENELSQNREERFTLFHPWTEIKFDGQASSQKWSRGIYGVEFLIDENQTPAILEKLAEAGKRPGDNLLIDEAFVGGKNDPTYQKNRDVFNRTVRESAQKELRQLIPILTQNHDQISDIQSLNLLKASHSVGKETRAEATLTARIESRAATLKSGILGLDGSPPKYYFAQAAELRSIVSVVPPFTTPQDALKRNDELLKRLESKLAEFQTATGIPEF